MKPSSVTKTSIIAAVFAFASHASASTIIFTDTYDSGTGAWYKAYNNATSTALTNDSGQLSWATGTTSSASGGYGVIGRSFSEQTLGVGESIRFSFDLTPTSDTGIVRAGMHDLSGGATASADDWANTGTGAYAGYATFFRDSGSNVTRVENGPMTTSTGTAYPLYMSTSGGGSATAIGDSATDYSLINSTSYQVSFEITRTSLSQTDTLFTVMDGTTTRYSVTGSQTSGTTYNVFDTAAIRFSQGTGLIDNAQVVLIPEPSAVLLGGLGILLILRRRR